MQTVLREELFSVLLYYLDDILVYSRTIVEHIERLAFVFAKLLQYGLKLEPRKCAFIKRDVMYLGHHVSAEGIATDSKKVDAVVNWPVPRTLKELRSFIGFASYCRRYVARFTQLASSLHKLVTVAYQEGKGRPRVSAKFSIEDRWDDDCQCAFESLKHAPVLGYADYSRPFIVETDACDSGLGAVLSQKQDDGRIRVIAYTSRELRGAEKNSATYSSKKLELLSFKWAITDKFREYLIAGKFVVFTDNNPPTYLMKTTKLPAIEQRWASASARFDFEIQYRSAKHNMNADVLSRLQQKATKMSSDNVSSCLCEASRSTCVKPSLRMCMVEAAINSSRSSQLEASTEDDITPRATGLPSISSVDMIELQASDPTIARLTW